MSTDQFKASNPNPDPNPNPNPNLNPNPNPHPHPHPSPSPFPSPTPTPTPTKASKRYHEFFLQAFLSPRFFGSSGFAGLGFSEINPKEKEINSLTQTVFYSTELMSRQARHVPTRSRCLVITPMVFYSLYRAHEPAGASRTHTLALPSYHPYGLLQPLPSS